MDKEKTSDSNNLRNKSLEWFFLKNKFEKIELKDKYFSNEYIEYDEQWGFHFTFGNIAEMYSNECKQIV